MSGEDSDSISDNYGNNNNMRNVAIIKQLYFLFYFVITIYGSGTGLETLGGLARSYASPFVVTYSELIPMSLFINEEVHDLSAEDVLPFDNDGMTTEGTPFALQAVLATAKAKATDVSETTSAPMAAAGSDLAADGVGLGVIFSNPPFSVASGPVAGQSIGPEEASAQGYSLDALHPTSATTQLAGAPVKLHAPMTVTVGTQAELLNALKTATPGSTILLRDGNYGDLKLYNYKFSDYVTIRSADDDGGAIIRSIDARDIEYIRFQNFTVERPLAPSEPLWTNAFYITRGKNLEINGIELYDTVDGNYENDGYGIGVYYTSNITISNCKIHHVGRGIVTSDTSNIIYQNNEIFDVRSDGMNFAAVRNAVIENNNIYRSHYSEAYGDHPDFIQFWSIGTAQQSSDVLIRNNVLMEKDGSLSQAIFIRGEKKIVDFINFTIENNLIVNSHVHGITIDGNTQNINIIKNTVLTNYSYTPSYISSINLYSNNVSVSNNVTTGLSITGSNVLNNHNIIVSPLNVLSEYNYDKLFINAIGGLSPRDFLPVPGSAIDFGKGVGAEALLATVEKPAVYIVPTPPAAGIDAYKVTLSAVPYPGGKMPAGPVTYTWDFGDGTSATGATVTHEFQTAGPRQVKVTVAGADGAQAIDRQVTVTNPLVLDLAFDGTLANQGSAGGTLAWTGAPSYTSGKTGPAANFETDRSSFVKLTGAGDAFSGLEQFSISFDFRAESLTNASLVWQHTVLGICATTSQTLDFYVGTAIGGFAKTVSVKVPQAFDGKWHNVVASYDALTGTATLFLDGVEVAVKTGLSGRTPVTTRELTIGADSWGGGFDGQIDNLRIYRGIVTPNSEAAILDSLRNRKGAGLFDDDGANRLAGGDGNDTLVGNAGNDTLSGGKGADSLDGGAGNDTFLYGAASESTPDAPDTIAGFDGAGAPNGDVIDVSALGNLTFIGTQPFSAANQVRVTQAGADVIAQIDLNGDGSADWQVVIRNATARAFVAADFGPSVTAAKDAPPAGTPGNDVLVGTSGNDTLNGLAGNDTLVGTLGNDMLFGSDGFDVVDYSGAMQSVDVNLATGTATGMGTDVLDGIEGVIGSAFADTLRGNSAANRLIGGPGNDSLYGDYGDDTLWGGDGDDLLVPGPDNDYVDGGDGNDTVDLRHTSRPATIDLEEGFAIFSSVVKTLVSIEHVYGSNGADLILGTSGANMLVGSLGNDTIDGRDGDDTLMGGDGNDLLIGGGGRDVYYGGNGNDTVDFSQVTSNIRVDQALSYADIAGEGKEYLYSIENVIGGSGNDWMKGTSGANLLHGGMGNDTLDGGGGDDTLIGGGGDDMLIGGAGRDRFQIACGDGNDRITDFATGVDVIELSGFPIADWNQLRALMTEGGGSVTLTLGAGQTLTLEGLSLASLTPGDFGFSGDDLVM